MVRVAVKPELLEWACDRAGYTVDSFTTQHPKVKLKEWIKEDVQPTFKQLEKYAKTTHAPIGYFFLTTPPEESVPIPDFRTIGDQPLTRPSPDLLDTIYICQQRQEWYSNYARTNHESPASFIGSAKRNEDPQQVAARIREELGFSIEERSQTKTWRDALRLFIEQSENLGVLVMISGVVGSNNNRKLDPEEFRGFALCDPLAPLVFVNGSDTKSAQMFTLAHELAHLWLGETALSDSSPRTVPSNAVEKWCNQVAAELLVPLEMLKGLYQNNEDLAHEIQRLARIFKVSTLVILRRIYDARKISRTRFWSEYDQEVDRLIQIMANRPPGSGGNFYNTTAARVSKLFAKAIISSTYEGRSSFSEALNLLGFKKMTTFKDFGRSVGVDI